MVIHGVENRPKILEAVPSQPVFVPSCLPLGFRLSHSVSFKSINKCTVPEIFKVNNRPQSLFISTCNLPNLLHDAKIFIATGMQFSKWYETNLSASTSMNTGHDF